MMKLNLSEETKGMIAAASAYTIFGFSYLFSKAALAHAEPIILLSIRFTITFIVLNILVFTKLAKLNFRGKKLLLPIVIGIIQPVLYFILENYGLKYTTTSFTGMIAAISPIFSAILGAIFLREHPTIKQWCWIAVSIIGVIMVSVGGSGGTNTLKGCLCLIGAYFVGGVYALLIRHCSAEFTSFELTYIMFTVGFMFFVAWAFIQYKSPAVSLALSALSHSDFIIGVLYLGILSSVVAYLLSNYSLSRLPVARSTIFGNMATVVSVAAGVLIQHDPFTPISAVSFVLILSGIIGAQKCARKQ